MASGTGRGAAGLLQAGRLLGRGGTAAAQAEAGLLDRFARLRDEAAFEALVEQHGPMVLGVCRRTLGRHAGSDADGAFQATFLVLARRAGSIRDADRLGPWLHGVARRVATRARARAAARHAREQPAAIEPAAPADAPGRLEAAELAATIDDELGRLPGRLRDPLVLCYLQGLTHDEAAARLGCPVGTVRSRLAGGRDRLRASLSRRGLAPPALAAGGLPAAAPVTVPAALISITTRLATAAGALVPGPVAALAQGALSAMFWKKLSIVAASLAASVTLGTAGVWAQPGEGPGQGVAPPQPPAPPADNPAIQKVAIPNDVNKDSIRFDLVHPEAVGVLKQLVEAKARIRQLEQDLEEARKRSGGMEMMGMMPGMTRNEMQSRNNPAPPPTIPAPPASAPSSPAEPGLPSNGALPVAGRGGAPKPAARATGGGFGGGMGGMMASDRPGQPMVLELGGSKLLTITSARDRATIHDLDKGTREDHPLPGGITSIGVALGKGLGALTMSGDAIDQIVVITTEDGKWHVEKLREPATRPIQPVVGPDRVTCRVGRHFYIFRAAANRWNVIDLE